MADFQDIDDATFERLSAKSQSSSTPKAISARYDARSRRIVLRLSNGIDVHFEPRLAHGLEEASAEQLKSVSVAGFGAALHFSALDADFTVSRLLEGFFGPLNWAKREARAAASRQNGKLGGRPKRAA